MSHSAKVIVQFDYGKAASIYLGAHGTFINPLLSGNMVIVIIIFNILVYTSIYMYLYIYICVCVCVYMYIYIYANGTTANSYRLPHRVVCFQPSG